MEKENGFQEYKREIIGNLRRHDEDIEKLWRANDSVKEKHSELKTEFLVLKGKLILLGALGGIVGTLLMNLVSHLKF